jgi:hypothetical protein
MGKNISASFLFLLPWCKKKNCYDKMHSKHGCVEWNKVSKFQAKGFAKVVWGLTKGPIFRKGMRQKWRWKIEFWVTNCEEWVHWTNQKHPKHVHKKLNKPKKIQTNMVIKHWTNQKNIQTNMIVKHWTNKKTSKPTWSLNIEQTKKHPN